jgi:hypothetical protein
MPRRNSNPQFQQVTLALDRSATGIDGLKYTEL